MKNILILGAGRSSSALIGYLLERSQKEEWKVVVADLSVESALKKTAGHPGSEAMKLDINNEDERNSLIASSDIVISLLPPSLHLLAARDCVKHSKPLVTASYVSEEIRALHTSAMNKGLLLLNEMGLDPGIDHMSAMQMINHLKEEGNTILAFKSYTGGLVAPESNDNPWGYKITWNPRNVVLAGQGTARFLEDGRIKEIPYEKLFKKVERISLDEGGDYEGYPNRDSLSYKNVYGLGDVQTMIRGTLRMPGFCNAWHTLVRIGWTDDEKIISTGKGETYNHLTKQLLHCPVGMDTGTALRDFLNVETDDESIEKIKWLGLFSDEKPGLQKGTHAQFLQEIIEKKWLMKPHDKDMIVMVHDIECRTQKGELFLNRSYLIVKGEDEMNTAMAKTVGLPAAIAAKLILQGKINLSGVQIPTHRMIYEPVMKELETLGIRFIEKTEKRV